MLIDSYACLPLRSATLVANEKHLLADSEMTF